MPQLHTKNYNSNPNCDSEIKLFLGDTLQLKKSSSRVHQQENLKHSGASLVVQWIRIRLPMQERQVRSLVQKAPTCHRVTEPMHCNY